MSNSARLSQTAANMGGSRGIFNEDALGHEVGMQNQVKRLIPILEKEYPNIKFLWKKIITQKEIIDKVALIDNVPPEELYIPVSEDSFVSPDGGVVYAVINGKEYPILISEAKKQGTHFFNEDGTLRKKRAPSLFSQRDSNAPNIASKFRTTRCADANLVEKKADIGSNCHGQISLRKQSTKTSLWTKEYLCKFHFDVRCGMYLGL